MRNSFFLLLFVCACGLRSNARIQLPAIIGNGMVLQQKSLVPVWGKAKANYMIKVRPSWESHTYSVRSDSRGAWKVLIKTPEAGGPYTLTFTDDEEITLKDILVGEVWLCSGQSNMEMPMTGYSNQPILNSNDAIAAAGNKSLRLFHVPHAVSLTPEYDCAGEWETAAPAAAAGFSAVGFQFGKRLQEILNVPVGIIQSTWGGTPVEAWMNREGVQLFGGRTIAIPAGEEKPDRLKPTCLYNGMISPVQGFGIKGFLWYQGEANVSRPSEYAALMQLMVEGWRKSWQNDSLFFYYVQIAPWNYGARKDSTPYLREAQYNALSKVPKSGMVVSMDKGSATTIHPPDKTTISNRLLYWALGDAYQVKGIAYQSPYFEKMQIRKDTITLAFKNAANGFYSSGTAIAGFEVAGKDKKFFPATARIFKKAIEVSSGSVKEPQAVRYAFTDLVEGNLYNTEGLPVAPFRTDNW
ncbi:sialate O-acetylesterase [Niabella beijingensis]|uniref:sialate O-acetylesterase n=1 Tax=Niabella beijingensis TaxID=2872700 RepID=UPI001CBE0945|nr:sialate O-acetylesterase [Niabella beijingensis]MBZ4192456.1 sialate O-acetylesterase [Niabella beijingensis]